jgi:catechol 2,3-dioxygenase-like lactoylglutathione lyase family enzyme
MHHPDAQQYTTTGITTPFGLGLHHTQITMPEGGEDEARAYYVGVLGMVELRKPDELATRGGIWVRSERMEVHLGVERPFAPALKAHAGILASELDALAAHLEARGHDVRWDDGFPEFRRFYSDDPFGNRLEFLEARERYAGPDHDWSQVTRSRPE